MTGPRAGRTAASPRTRQPRLGGRSPPARRLPRTPCAEWDVQRLVNHMTRGNLNYVALLDGGSAAEFLRLRDTDALHGDPVGAYVRSERECAAAFRRPGALAQILDHPLGPMSGEQALAVRTTDATIHAWDLARAIKAPEELDPGLVAWIEDHLADIYADLAESPVSADTTHRFFAAPVATSPAGESRQARLLRLMGR
ncbi:TIGR03086 family metal-binding protein [Streptomyces sp. NPDC004286]|uniref:TIGR03086 family metal-binding protein n=1 Tax=Streptomyces sp. NPDC004286 TaxID=3364696 RepID=UPI00369FC874